MTTTDNFFQDLFEKAKPADVFAFTERDVAREGICIPDFAQEGWITAIGGDIARDFTDAYKEVKGWFLGIESKRRYIEQSCLDTIEWLREEDRDNPHLDLDMGTFKTWCKTSATFHWRYYFLLHDQLFNELVAAAKNNEITNIEVVTDFDMKNRMKVTRMLDSIRTIKDLIVVVEKYRSRCNLVFELLLKRKRKIQNFPLQVMLLGYADLNRTVKKIVNLAT